MDKTVLLKDQAGAWWIGSADVDGCFPNPLALNWPQLFIERLQDPTKGAVQLGMGSPFASFRLPALTIAWTAVAVISELENVKLCQIYLQAVQHAKGTGIQLVTPNSPAR